MTSYESHGDFCGFATELNEKIHCEASYSNSEKLGPDLGDTDIQVERLAQVTEEIKIVLQFIVLAKTIAIL